MMASCAHQTNGTSPMPGCTACDALVAEATKPPRTPGRGFAYASFAYDAYGVDDYGAVNDN